MGELMANITTKTEFIDDDLFYKERILKLEDYAIRTPYNASDDKNYYSPINEIYKNFDFSTLTELCSDFSSELKLNKEIDSKKINDRLNFPFFKYVDNQPPQEEHVKLLADLALKCDVITTPLWTLPSVKDEKKMSAEEKARREAHFVDLILKSNKIFFERISQNKEKKTIIGTIPFKVSRKNIDEIFDMYQNMGIDSFVIDCNGSSLITADTWLTNAMIIIDELQNEKGFTYSINSYEGRFLKGNKETPAKDYISHGAGVDILGLNHIPPKLSPQIWRDLSQSEKTYKIFNKETYGYQRINNETLLKEAVNLDINPNLEPNRIRRIYNSLQKNNENETLKEILEDREPVKEYIILKKQIPEKDIKVCGKIRNKVVRD
ncbi:hypothetical protein [Methanolapillus millepedarum]|uniref:Uncharacterized protein n=1 Tax=Methanolapillus millepedarum TaxID=3028296 RepID=A0AA96ZUM4_9EURY|nr:hypothetical protein MsAc7_00080 [Methanosarcinaceae archaeon Ac7]